MKSPYKSAVLRQLLSRNWTNRNKSCINDSHFEILFGICTMALTKEFEQERGSEAAGITRRGALLGGAATVAFASLPLGKRAEAQSGQVATAPADRELNAVQGMRDMRRYSENKQIQGIGIFINLQADAPMTGEQIGERLRAAFAGLNPPVSAQYRVNQSRGTATDITFYVRGIDFTLGIGEIKGKLGTLLAHHRDVWQPERLSSAEPVAPTRQ